MRLAIRYEGRPRPWARPHTYRKPNGAFVRTENKASHWSRKAFDAMKKLWADAWLTRDGDWDPNVPMDLHVTAHFDGRDGGYLEAALIPSDEIDEYASAPDIDNVCKLVVEAAQKAGVITNDSRVVFLIARKTKAVK